MKPTMLSLSVKAMFGAGAVLAAPAFAQDAPMQRVEVTGSSIKRIAAETAQPLTIIKAEEFTKQGLTTAQEALSRTLPTRPASAAATPSAAIPAGCRRAARPAPICAAWAATRRWSCSTAGAWPTTRTTAPAST